MAVTINGTTGITSPGLSADSPTLVVDDVNNRVGIGFSNPTSKLQIDGDILIRTSTAGMSNQSLSFSEGGSGNSYAVRIGHTANTALAFERYDQGWSEMMRIVGNGNVGIGTTNPLSKLHVEGTILTQLLNSSPYIISRGSYSDNTIYTFYNNDTTGITNPAAGVIGFKNGGTYSLYLTSDNKVGIGTTIPSTRLHIRQSADFDGITLSHATRTGIWKIYHSGTSSENIAFIQNNGTSDAVSYVAGRDLHDWYTAGTSKMNLNSSGNLYISGNVGIGTTASVKLDVLGFSEFLSDGSAPASTVSPSCYVASGNSSDSPVMEIRQGRFNRDVLTLSTNQSFSASFLSVVENGVDRFRINGVNRSNDAGNAVFTTGDAFDSSNYFVLQNNTDAYGRIGLVIRGKTFSSTNTPSLNDGWSLASARSSIRFDAYLSGDSSYDTKFSIQHLMANATNNSIGDLGFHAKGYSTTSPALLLTATGNFGIGATNPYTKLHVYSQSGAAVVEQVSSISWVMRQKIIQSYSNATATTLFTASNMFNCGLYVEVTVRGVNAVGNMAYKDTFYAFRYQVAGTYQSSNVTSNVQTYNIAGSHTAGTLAWVNVSSSTPSLVYTQGGNGYILESLDVNVVARDGASITFNASYVSFG